MPLMGDKVMQALQEQCIELKRASNSLNEENMKTRTRLRVLERELQRRDRLLRQLAMVNKGGQCVDMDIIEKLREERNMLPMVRKRSQDLQGQVLEKEQEIRDLKRDPLFTRIIELQVEYATWQHEAKRLGSLLLEASTDANPVARQEVEVHEQRRIDLQNKLKKEMAARDKATRDIGYIEGEHASSLESYHDMEIKLQGEQELTRELAMSFKKVLQERKQAEQIQSEVEEMELTKLKYEQEKMKLETQARTVASASQSPINLGRATVSPTALGIQIGTLSGRVASLLNDLCHIARSRAGENSLYAEFLRRDADRDGLLSDDELGAALAAVGLTDCSPVHVAALLELAPGSESGVPAKVTKCGLRWLDLLVILDRSQATLRRHPLPPFPPLQALCLRAELTVEEFQRSLRSIRSRDQAEAFFQRLASSSGLLHFPTDAWVTAWEAYGSDGLLLRLPMGDIAINQVDFDAWFARCTEAVRNNRKELIPSFKVWREDMLLDQEQFNMVCLEVLGLHLSLDDISDLALFISGDAGGHGGLIDGGALLRIDELRRRR